MPPEQNTRTTSRPGSAMFWLAIAYGALVVYGTLFPLDEWSPPLWRWTNPITAAWPQSASRADLLVNLLAYVPLGLFLALGLRPRTGTLMAIAITVSLGTALSFALETLQSALPSRVPSGLDWVLNAAGTMMGALVAALLDPHFAAGRTFLQWRQTWFTRGSLSNLALVVVLLWGLTQVAPFVPSLDWGNLKSGLKPLGNTLRHPSTFDAVRAVESALQILALGLLIRGIERRPLLWPFVAFAFAVLLYKVPVVGRQLTLEALTGWLGAALLLAGLPARTPAVRMLSAAAALLTAHALAQFEPGKDAATSVINWIPFRGQVGTVSGMLDILETLWPFMALGLLARWSTVWRWRRVVMWAVGAAVVSLAFLLEWMQQSIPGRFADVTDVILAGFGWLLPWLYAETRGSAVPTPSVRPTHTIRWLLPALAAAMISVSVAGWMAGSQVRIATDERGRTMLPTPESLTQITLPGFRYPHPRLPHPSEKDILRLRLENPDWIEQNRRAARGGEGRLEAVILMAYIEPGSQDLALLRRGRIPASSHHPQRAADRSRLMAN
jgi:glycopeptide antibiotics resistance protein